MKILQRYVLRELLSPFVMAVIILSFILLTTQLFRLTEYLINKGISLDLLGRFLLTLTPQILTLTMPMGLLVAVLLVFGRLSADREIMAIRTSGVNLVSLYWPMVIVALIMCGALFYFTNFLVPDSRLGLTNLKSEVTYILQGAIEPGIWHQPDAMGDDRVSLKYESRSPDDNRLRHVQMYLVTSEATEEGERNQVAIRADYGEITPIAAEDALAFQLDRGAIHIFDKYKPQSYSMVRFNRLNRDIRLETDRVQKRGLKEEEQNTPRLMASIGQLQSGLYDPKRLNAHRTELWERWSMPFAALAFVLMGMPLGVMGRTSGKAAGFSVAFGLIFIYYILLKWGESLGLDGSPLAFWAIMSPNVILSGIGLYLIYRTVRT